MVLKAVLSACRSSKANRGRGSYLCGFKEVLGAFEEVLTSTPLTRELLLTLPGTGSSGYLPGLTPRYICNRTLIDEAPLFSEDPNFDIKTHSLTAQFGHPPTLKFANNTSFFWSLFLCPKTPRWTSLNTSKTPYLSHISASSTIRILLLYSMHTSFLARFFTLLIRGYITLVPRNKLGGNGTREAFINAILQAYKR